MAGADAAAAARIFLSYRRDDTAGYARALADELGRRFGAERVFIDVDDIGAGLPFKEVIGRAIGGSQVLLVLIGKRWRGERDGGAPRLRDADDLVRREVAAGLARGMRVIPLLFDGAAMPSRAELPAELQPLAGHNALAIDGARFAGDFERLIAALGPTIGPAPGAPAPAGSRRAALAGLSGVVLVAAAAAAALWVRPPPLETSRRPPVNGAWQADVDYDWPNAHYVERFAFGGEAGELQGSASFLGIARGVLDGRVDADGLHFVTRTGELVDGASVQTVHRYRGRLVDGELRLVMQTEGGASAHVPVEFVARRAVPVASRPER